MKKRLIFGPIFLLVFLVLAANFIQSTAAYTESVYSHPICGARVASPMEYCVPEAVYYGTLVVNIVFAIIVVAVGLFAIGILLGKDWPLVDIFTD